MVLKTKKDFLLVFVLFFCSISFLYSAADEIGVNTTVSYSRPGQTKVQGVIPRTYLGEKLNFQISMEQKSNWKSIGKAAKNVGSFFYDIEADTKTVVVISLHSLANPDILQYSKVELIDYGFDVDPETYTDSDGWVYYSIAWGFRSNDTMTFDFQVTPQETGNYGVFIVFYKVKDFSSFKTLEEAMKQGLVTILSESDHKYSFQVVE